MSRYLKAAFWAAPEVAGLGRLPVNVILLCGLLILGFGHPGFWLLAAALEGGFLYGLTSNPRFRHWVDARDLQLETTSAEMERVKLTDALPGNARQRLAALEEKSGRILQLYREADAEKFVIESNAGALQRLSWLFLKLLLAQKNLQKTSVATSEAELRQKMAALERDLATAGAEKSVLRESKLATLHILQQRLTNLMRRSQLQEEIESDLVRIESQIDLAVENAGIQGHTETISANVDLASRLLDDTDYGDAGASIAAWEKKFGEQPQ